MRQALYRLYRPGSFAQVVGQDPIVTVLRNQMRDGSPSHAYLFVGPRGTGKTTCAKPVAKAVNCLEPRDGDPCGSCENCRGVEDGSLFDVVEIDAASNNGVDSIRALRNEVTFTPSKTRYRVYIIDEVHMLSSSAFNALLKTLEEPPSYVIFILATTEIHKIPSTIVSRCQRFDFRRIENDTIADRLLAVCDREKIALEPQAALLIARLADGGMRDALSLLDVCSASNEPVTVELVAQAAGLAGSDHLMELTGRIAEEDTAGMLKVLDDLIGRGMDPQRIASQLIQFYRNLVFAKILEAPERLLDCLPSEVEALKEQAQALSLPDLLHGIAALQEASGRLARSAARRTELEMTLLSLCEPAAKTGYPALLARVERLEAMLRRGDPGAAPTPPAPALESAPPARRPETPAKPAAAPAFADKAPDPPPPPAAEKKDAVPPPEPSPPLPFRPWPQVIDRLHGFNSGVAQMLRGAKAYFDGRRVLIDVSNPAVLEMLKSNDYTRRCVRQAILEATGQNIAIGPYRPVEAEKEAADPLAEALAALPAAENISIE